MHRALLSVHLEVRYQKVERIPQPFGGQGTGDWVQGTGDRQILTRRLSQLTRGVGKLTAVANDANKRFK